MTLTHACIVGLTISVLVSSPLPANAVNVRECQALSQRYSEIKRAATSIERNSLLFSSAKHECEALAKTLLDDGASLEARDRLGNMPLANAAQNGHAGLVALFIERKAPIDARNLEASTALFLASEAERRVVAELLLAAGANPNIAGRGGIPPIGAAAYTGNIELVRLLLDRGADPRAYDATGKTAMVYAAGRCFKGVVDLLIQRGIDVNEAGVHGLTPLMWAAGHSDEAGVADVKETIELLIAQGAKLDGQDDRGMTALMIATELGHRTAVEALLKAGADTMLMNKSGKSARELATDDVLKAALAAK